MLALGLIAAPIPALAETEAPHADAVATVNQQKVTISGIVKDEAGEPIIGASVVEKGNTTNGTITDLDGNYLPMPIHITDNILDGHMTNAHYDLDAVINRLKDEPTIFALGTMPYNRDIKVPLEVKTIPIYNQMDKADKMLDFYIVPSQDLYNIYIRKGMDDRGWFLETMYGIKKNLVLERTIYGKIKLQ